MISRGSPVSGNLAFGTYVEHCVIPAEFESHSMPQVTIFTTPYCPYCTMAKRLLTTKAVAFEEIDVSRDRAERQALVGKSGGSTTVPQIWIGERHIGGCDDLYALDRSGKLDALLAV